MFETDRLRIRARRSTDSENLHILWNDPQVQKTLTIGHTVPSDGMPDNKDPGTLFSAIIETKEGNEFIGFTIWFMESPKNRDAGFGIALLPKYWSKGYAKEALRFLVDYSFHQLALHRVTLTVFENNKGAIELYKKIGFVQERVQRKAIWLDGRWQDVIGMGILDETWAAERKHLQ
ncbi:acyl-CoA N-acyltransferase [Gymnopus androsaceus JB14]|uniref:Acyl-CoA N-acyltransferase n=1 Tax=Gymnopus androsaceus JB14 TaxID=1447944 RepID=A0A6A4I5I3_9AGAR|nr:acyl-CoA N-acyltransferase [Gymnopus androsaceus JB14]